MFSSFAQYLPSALQNTISVPLVNHQDDSQEPPPQSTFDPTTDDEGDEEGLVERVGREQDQRLENDENDEDRRRPKSKKEKLASETFIFVRPPPSKSNHPLNLQVQLVPPNGRAPSGIAPPNDAPTTPTSASSVSTSASDGGRRATSVSRSASNRSTDSNYSTNHSSTSTTSFSSMTTDASGASSATSSSSGRNPRRIVPLYNLQAHNVLTNTIVDAGTDAKIAKFQKRGLELIDLAILEPVEVWGVRSKEAKREGMMISVDEMGTIVHSPGINRGSVATNRNLLQPTQARQGSRPGTPSANSSAVSLHTNSTHVSHNRPQLLVSPPRDPPASAPPLSGNFPGSQLPQPTSDSKSQDHPFPLVQPASPGSDFSSSLSTTPTKKSSAASLFGKLKFNAKRQSVINPATSPIAEVPSRPISPTAGTQQPNDFGQFGMVPLAPGDLIQRPTSTIQVTPATPTRPVTIPPPLEIAHPSSSPATPSPITPKAVNTTKSDSELSPTPTISPPRIPAARSPPTRSGSIKHERNLSLTGALARGKSKLIGGAKILSSSESTEPSPPATGGARGFFNKLAGGIAGVANTSNAANESNSGVLFPSRTKPPSRTSIDSSHSNVGGIKGKFDRILSHSSSQQFIGNGGTGTGTPKVSTESQRPQTALTQLLHQPVIPPPQPLQPSTSQSQIQGSLSGQTTHVTLRQLQLRPPVLGIQPTYVSASTAHTAAYHDQLSTASLTSQPQALPTTENHADIFLRQIESKSSLTGTTEGTTEESYSTSAVSKQRSESRPNTRPGSARNSLNLDRDGVGLVAAAPNSSTIPPANAGPSQQLAGKEKALMYVWLVRKWLKKRKGDTGGYGFGPFGHSHGTSESKAGGLFSNLVGNRERRETTDGNAAGNRGSWHGGTGIGAIPSLAALGTGSHSQQPSMAAGGGGFVLGPVVGGGIEVRFEWKRAKGKKDKKTRRKDKERDKGKGKLPEVKSRDMLREKTAEQDETPRAADASTLVGKGLVDSPQKVSGADRGRRRDTRGSMASLESVGDGLSRSSSTRSRKSSVSPGQGLISKSPKKRLSLRLRGLDNDEDEGDDGEESDAEDSETPWVCTLKIRRVLAGGIGVSSGGGPSEPSYLYPRPAGSTNVSSENFDVQEKEQIVRLKVGTLSQTPHHPKVVAMLKIPFPLPDVEVERMEIVPRKPGVGPGVQPSASPGPSFPSRSNSGSSPLNHQGGGPSSQPSTASLDGSQDSDGSSKESYKGLVLTAEEIKDVVCSTGLWLAVREGFGGVGKVNRKGDGWKIRG